ncbi:uncharacterized protein METZ01_LOCUS304156, partial [marine metagenome]
VFLLSSCSLNDDSPNIGSSTAEPPDVFDRSQQVAWISVLQDGSVKCLYVTVDEDGNWVDKDGTVIVIESITDVRTRS